MGLAGWLASLALIVLQGCSFSQPAAPVLDKAPAGRAAKPGKPASATRLAPAGTYVVQAGDTLYKIAFEQGLDYRQLAEWNGLPNPDLIRVGESLRLTAPPRPASSAPPAPPPAAPAAIEVRPLAPLSSPLPSAAPGPAAVQAGVTPAAARAPSVTKGEQPVLDVDVDAETAPQAWTWPARGSLVAAFDEAGGMKGLEIAAARGAAVRAAAPGRVVYAGAGLRGYGKLIIIKHSKMLLSAYGHNERLLVKEGQAVHLGQVIAEMGDSDAERVKLHFEIREYGKPVNPASYLPALPG